MCTLNKTFKNWYFTNQTAHSKGEQNSTMKWLFYSCLPWALWTDSLVKYQFLKVLCNVSKFLGFQTVLILDWTLIHALIVFFTDPNFLFKLALNVLCAVIIVVVLWWEIALLICHFWFFSVIWIIPNSFICHWLVLSEKWNF